VIRNFFALLLAILREIGDESAYSRYLELHRLEASGPAWRAFSEHRMRARYARAKCC
jgi:hypothetical protein